MKIKDGFFLREVAGQNIVVPVGEKSLDFNCMINLNSTGVFLWKNMEENTDIETLTEKMLKEYDIDKNTAESDINDFINKLQEADLIE